MDAILTRITRSTRRPFGRLLLTMAQATAERLVLPQRDLPRDWFRLPLP